MVSRAQEIARDAILAATLLACIFLWSHQPTPAKVTQTDYCVVDYHAGAYDQNHRLRTGWVKGYGPCSLLDRFEEI